MADIFISWGSPDRDAVLPLRDLLRGLGLDVWEYSEDMGAGDRIQARVMKTIEQVRVAILCLSDAAVQREWVRNEIAVCAYARETGQIEHLIPVKVGALSDDNLPLALRNLDLFALDLADPALKDANTTRLLDDIDAALEETAPVVMPAAIFAMKESESMSLFDGLRRAYEEARARGGAAAADAGEFGDAGDDESEEAGDPSFTEEQEELWKLCTLVGMKDPPHLYEFLQQRYGNTPGEMTPFHSDRKIADVVNEVLGEVNRARIASGHRPIFLRWVTDELFRGSRAERRIVREWWRNRDSLLIIDSVSTFHPAIKERLIRLRAERSALLWLPPYTRHTAGMEEALRSAAEAIPALGDEFTDLGAGRNPRRAVSFDTSTSLALQVWLRRALLHVSDESSALEGNVAAVASMSPPPGDISSKIFRRKDGTG